MEKDAGPLLRAPLRGRPSCEDPPATSVAPPGAPSRDAQAWPVGRPGALFSLPGTPRGGTQQAAWALQDLFIFLWELSSEHRAEGIRILSGGPSYSSLSLRRLRPARRWARGQVQPCLVWNPALEFWLEPENGLDSPYLVGKQGCRLLGN